MKKKELGFLPYSDGNISESNSEKLLDQLLRTDPMAPLPVGFAERTALKAVRRITLKQSLAEFFIFTAVIVAAGLIFTGIHYFTDAEGWVRWEKFFSSNTGLLAGISLILCFIFFADHVLFPWLFFPGKNKIPDPSANR